MYQCHPYPSFFHFSSYLLRLTLCLERDSKSFVKAEGPTGAWMTISSTDGQKAAICFKGWVFFLFPFFYDPLSFERGKDSGKWKKSEVEISPTSTDLILNWVEYKMLCISDSRALLKFDVKRQNNTRNAWKASLKFHYYFNKQYEEWTFNLLVDDIFINWLNYIFKLGLTLQVIVWTVLNGNKFCSLIKWVWE